MCGIVGVYSLNETTPVTEALCTIQHRGPDHRGIWEDKESGVILGHVRLSILDLSSAGNQPMLSQCGRYVITFNGEIYNHEDLRRVLTEDERLTSPLSWHGHSDTETLLACISRFGLERTLELAVGMFAFALWDRQNRLLHLARDRMGEKPLYYGWIRNGFAFASELKALKALPGFQSSVDRAALALYVRHGAVPHPHSIYEAVRKLPPGTWLTVSPTHIKSRGLPQPQSYWDLMSIALKAIAGRNTFDSDASAVAALDSILKRSIKDQMVADVPLGAFLSGGVDSSTVASLMQTQSARPIRTFTIGFGEKGYDEAAHARKVARHLGTDHADLYVTADAARDVIPKLPELYCEPFADSSQIPTYLLARFARRHVKVALSGDGGDELFGGYNRHVLGAGRWRLMSRIPKAFRLAVSRAVSLLPASAWSCCYSLAAPFVPRRWQLSMPAEQLYKAAEGFRSSDGADLYRRLTTNWEPSDIVLEGHEPKASLSHYSGFESLAEYMMAMDAATYLPNDILVKVDRAAMACSLETRVPLLDHRVVEFAWKLPLSLKLRDGQGKWILRQVLSKYAPEALVDRPKMGFAVPIGSWLRGPLREWADDLLDESRLRREGHFNPEPIRRKWLEHVSGQCNWQQQLWTILMFQAWFARWQT